MKTHMTAKATNNNPMKPGAWIVESECKDCGTKTIGYVAVSKKDPFVSEKIAKQWESEINSGNTFLRCEKCLRNAKDKT